MISYFCVKSRKHELEFLLIEFKLVINMLITSHKKTPPTITTTAHYSDSSLLGFEVTLSKPDKITNSI